MSDDTEPDDEPDEGDEAIAAFLLFALAYYHEQLKRLN